MDFYRTCSSVFPHNPRIILVADIAISLPGPDWPPKVISCETSCSASIFLWTPMESMWIPEDVYGFFVASGPMDFYGLLCMLMSSDGIL